MRGWRNHEVRSGGLYYRYPSRKSAYQALLAAAAGLVVAAAVSHERFVVSGRSMAPALQPGDRLAVRRWPRRLRPGVLVVVADPRASDRLMVKRVAALDGDRVAVLGDNASASTDSRTLGPVPRSAVRGRVVYRYAPAGRTGRLPPVEARGGEQMWSVGAPRLGIRSRRMIRRRGIAMNKDQARMALLGINLVVGVGFLLFPKQSMRLYGLDPETDAAAAYPVRYVGARSLVFAAMLADDEGQAALIRQLPVIAAVDATANGLALISAEVPRRVALLGALTSAAALTVGAMSREQ